MSAIIPLLVETMRPRTSYRDSWQLHSVLFSVDTILHISTYPPRLCGNAETTREIIAGVETIRPDWRHRVAAINYTADEVLKYPQEVSFVLRKGIAKDFTHLSSEINASPQIKLVHLHYEARLFGEPLWKRAILTRMKSSRFLHHPLMWLFPFRADEYVLHLLRQIHKPIVTTLWAANVPGLRRDFWLRRRFKAIALASKALVVHSRFLKNELVECCALPESKIRFLPAGSIPPNQPGRPADQGSPFPRGKIVFLSAGLIRPSKGLDVAIDAFNSIKDSCPEAQYCIVGAPHPELKGRQYVEHLREKIAELDLEGRVVLKPEFLSVAELIRHLSYADICVMPYRPRHKYASGLLAYSLACGTPCIATRFAYAVEYLGSGAGALVDFGSVKEMAQAMRCFAGSTENLNKARETANRVGAELRWDNAAGELVEFYTGIMEDP